MNIILSWNVQAVYDHFKRWNKALIGIRMCYYLMKLAFMYMVYIFSSGLLFVYVYLNCQLCSKQSNLMQSNSQTEHMIYGCLVDFNSLFGESEDQ